MLPSQLWRFIGFYGHPEGHRHRQSWALLNRLNGMDQLPWLCMGDFNEILSVDEHVGEVPGMYGRMEDFNEMVNRCGLLDMGFRGVPFTWDNRRTGEGFVQKRLDRRWPSLLGLNASILVRSAMFFAPTPTMSLYFSRWMSVLAVIAPNGAPKSLKRSGFFILNVK